MLRDVTIASIYGGCEDQRKTRCIMSNTRMQGHPDIQVIGADWNATVEEVAGWLQEEWNEWEVVAPATDTCFAAGGISSRIDFFVVNKMAKNLLQGIGIVQAEAHHTPLRTHRVVTLTLQIQGSMWLEKWTRQKSIPAQRIFGPCRDYADIEREKGNC